MAEAVLSAGPMPEPVSLYQGPLSFGMSMPAIVHSRSSAACVPLLSARDTNGACATLTFCNPPSTSLPPAFAGSAFGPIRMKSLYMTR